MTFLAEILSRKITMVFIYVPSANDKNCKMELKAPIAKNMVALGAVSGFLKFLWTA